jgi:hypothetical protein
LDRVYGRNKDGITGHDGGLIMDIIEKFTKGFEVDALTKQESEQNKKLILRGGSVGCVIGNGESCGNNPQEALARFIGYELPKDDTAPFYFAAGFANEDIWQNNLRKAGYKILTDAEEKIEAEIGGFKFTGSPDIRILGEDGKPTLGLELKAVCSASTASDVFIMNKPKFKHVAQAAIYSHFLKVPYILVYTNYCNFYPHSSVSRKEKVWKVPPGVKEFPIQIDDKGSVLVKIGRKFVPTIITIPGILQFYEAIGVMYNSKRPNILRPRNVDIFGEPEDFNGRGELAYDSFHNKAGYAEKWPEFITNLRRECKFVGGESVI